MFFVLFVCIFVCLKTQEEGFGNILYFLMSPSENELCCSWAIKLKDTKLIENRNLMRTIQ